MENQIKQFLQESAQVKERMILDEDLIQAVARSVKLICAALQQNKKLLIFGNGGSAADAQHFAAELVNRFKIDRRPLPALSLVTDTSLLSSIANDSGYEYVFSKQIEALGEKGDIAFGITTSDIAAEKEGHSANIAHALIAARKKGLVTIGLVSEKSKNILSLLDVALQVPSSNTPRIQEAHITVIHVICEIVEKLLFSQQEQSH